MNGEIIFALGLFVGVLVGKSAWFRRWSGLPSIEAAAEIARRVADEKGVLALSADESNYAPYREGERTARDIESEIRSLMEGDR